MEKFVVADDKAAIDKQGLDTSCGSVRSCENGFVRNAVEVKHYTKSMKRSRQHGDASGRGNVRLPRRDFVTHEGVS